MKSKNIALMSLSILSLVFLMSFVAAATLEVNDVVVPTSVDENAGTFEITFNLSYAGVIDNKSITFTDSAVSIGSISIPETFMNEDDSDDGDVKLVTATVTLPAGHAGETLTGSINATGATLTPAEVSFSVDITATPVDEEPEISEDCNLLGNDAGLDIRSVKINVESGFGDDEDYWYPLDEISVEFDIKNDGDWDIENVEFLICLWDVDAEECIYDEGDMDLSDDDLDLDEGDKETVTVSFTLGPDDLSEGNTDYVLYISATGTVDDKDAPVGIQDEDTCVLDSESIEIRTDEDFVAINNFEHPDSVAPGEEVTIKADIWNLGDQDIDEDDIFILVVCESLKLEKEIPMGDLNSFDNEEITVTFTIPEDADTGRYHIFEFGVYDNEDMDDNDLYQNSEDDEALYRANVKVEGEATATPEDLVVTASLESGGEAGKELIIKTTLINSGDESQTYLVSAATYTDWASSVDVSENAVIVASGQSKDVTFTFDVKKDASGENTFNIEVLSEGQLVKRQAVSVDIEGSKFSMSLGDNWYLWLIGLLNVILVVVIIIVAVRVARS